MLVASIFIEFDCLSNFASVGPCLFFKSAGVRFLAQLLDSMILVGDLLPRGDLENKPQGF